jgi:glycosyltransferase involved in cell wall biosynthesis
VRALFVTPRLDVGGLERQWSHLVPGLIERGIDVEVATLDGKGHFFHVLAAKGIPADCLELHGRLNVVGTYRAAGALARSRPDIVLSAGVSGHVVGQVTSFRAHCPHVAAIHAVPEHPDTFTPRRRLIVRLLSRWVSASVAVTSAQLPFLRSLGFDPTRTHVIPNGVEGTEPRRSRGVVRAELGLAEQDLVALLVATLRPEKRVDLFVDAVVAAHRSNESVRGLIAGGGDGLRRIELLCRESGLVARALGPRADIPDLIAASDVLCLTSDAEALPMAILEAMAAGRPVIATNVGGIRDAVLDGETGFLVPRGDCARVAQRLLRLAEDPELRDSLGEAGRERYRERFTLDRMVDAYHALLERVASEYRQRRSARSRSTPR